MVRVLPVAESRGEDPLFAAPAGGRSRRFTGSGKIRYACL